jgi:spore maturation protein B
MGSQGFRLKTIRNETTLYVLAVYFGSVAIRRGRHALAAGLLADTAGVAASLVICRLVF